MSRTLARFMSTVTGVPRASGDEPGDDWFGRVGLVCSPQ